MIRLILSRLRRTHARTLLLAATEREIRLADYRHARRAHGRSRAAHRRAVEATNAQLRMELGL
jgi:hypothetical protein